MRLIDADALLQRAVPHGWSTPLWVSDIVIEDAPTIDAEPVRHGHWIKKDHVFYDNYRYECSECHHYDEHSESREVPYCWHCGARMDLKEVEK